MSYTLDANLLLYASDEASPLHDRALSLVRRVAEGPDIAYLFWPTVMAYLRIATHPVIFSRPLSPEVAMANLENLLSLPHVRSPGEQERFWGLLREIERDADARGNLVPDAHLVALMQENGVKTIWTRDRDYRRFRHIDVRDPFEIPDEG